MAAQKILVIDDDPNAVRMLGLVLRVAGFEVMTAYDGEEGLEQLYTHHPDLVLLDIVLPRMSGWTVCQRIREFSDVPVIMLTGVLEPTAVEQSIGLGADDYIRKPFHPRVLLARIQAKLRRARGELRQTNDR